MVLDFFRSIFVTLDQFTEENDLGQVCPELVMNIASDPGAFFFERFLLAFPESLYALHRQTVRQLVDRNGVLASIHAAVSSAMREGRPGQGRPG